MEDLEFLVPLLAGLGVMLLPVFWQVPKRQAMNLPITGVLFMGGAVLWWLSSALLLVRSGESYFMIDFLTPAIFLFGLSFIFGGLVSTPRMRLRLLVGFGGAGLGLGFVHGLALYVIPAWPAFLVETYVAMGLGDGPTPAP